MKKKKIKYQYKNTNQSLVKTLFVGLVLILSFAILPNFIKFIDKSFKTNEIVINSSKQNFDEVFDKQKKNNTSHNKINNKFSWDIFDDIDVFGKDEQDEDPQRLSASTIEELFNENGYSLEEVKKNKILNVGNQLTRLPKELKNIESPKKRKKLFIQIVLPLIIEENLKIRFDRKKLFEILNKNITTKRDKSWLELKFKQYGVKNKDFSQLKIRMDEIPVSLAIAQAAKETGWGSSRFAQEGNALFGQWTWSGDGIKPLDIDKNEKHKVAKFKILKASVRAYQRNLNTHSSYKKFRIERAIQRDNNGKLNSLKLVGFLDKYAETGKEYTEVLKKIINQNNLTDFDDVEILPTSLKMKNLI
jgi:Bax protein